MCGFNLFDGIFIIKIAVIHNLPAGGAKRALQDWVIGLSKRHSIDLFTYTKENNSDDYLKNWVGKHEGVGNLSQYSGGTVVSRALYLVRMRKEVKKIAKKINLGNHDVVFVHQCTYLQNPLILKYLKKPTVFYSQDTPQRNFYEPGIILNQRISLNQRIQNRLNILNIRHVDCVLTSSYYTYESLKKIYGINANVVYFGIDLKTFFPSKLPKGDFILSVGRLHHTKGHDFIIKSLGEVNTSIRPKLKIVCESEKPESIKNLKNLADELKVDLEFEYGIEDERLRELYSNAMFTVCAYVMEPLGFVALESMACGTPVLGVKEAGLRETILDGYSGLLADRNPKSFSNSIQKLVENKELLERLSKNTVSYIQEKWSLNDSIDKIEYHLLETLTLFGGDECRKV